MTDMLPESQEEVQVLVPDKHEPEKLKLANPQADTVTFSRVTLNYIVIALTFLAVGILIGSFGLGQSATSADEQAMQRAVREVLLAEGLIEPLENMSQLIDDDPYLGSEDAPIVIVEFSAYACPYCGRHFTETFEPLLENYGQYIRYVYRDFPSINPTLSYPAAVAANCARTQDKFWEYHSQLFENQDLLSQAYYLQLAGELELNMPLFTDCYQNQEYMDEVEADFNTGIALGISGTPSFYINGRFYSGARPYAYFERIIKRELDALGIAY